MTPMEGVPLETNSKWVTEGTYGKMYSVSTQPRDAKDWRGITSMPKDYHKKGPRTQAKITARNTDEVQMYYGGYLRENLERHDPREGRKIFQGYEQNSKGGPQKGIKDPSENQGQGYKRHWRRRNNTQIFRMIFRAETDSGKGDKFG